MRGEYKIPGGKLVIAEFELIDQQLQQIEISGDFFLEPDHALGAVRAALTSAPATISDSDLTERISAALAGADMLGITPEGIAIAVRRALESNAVD